MKTVWVVVISIISVAFLAVAGMFVFGYFKQKPGGILVDASPSSSVFVNGSLVGSTPYEGTFEEGEVLVKIVPEATDKNYVAFESKVNITSGAKTVVRREFGDSEEASSGDIITFEKEAGKESSLVVISNPDSAQISIDGTPRGFSPYKTSLISSGEHQISVKATGYTDRVLTIRTLSGYRLTVLAKLAKIPVEESKVEGVKTEVKTFIEILETPTGFLRVRSEPKSMGREIHQVAPGEKYLFLSEDPETGWFEIQIEEPKAGLPEGRSGWVSNEYSKKIEEEVTLNPAD